MKTSTNRMNRLQSSFNNQQPIISPSTAHHPAAAANHFPIIGQSFRYYRTVISQSSANHPTISAQYFSCHQPIIRYSSPLLPTASNVLFLSEKPFNSVRLTFISDFSTIYF